MHACGHDGHCATALAVAYALYQIKEQLNGKIKFIFQPAEEGGKGSTAMIEAGVLENPTVDEIYGFHNWPGLPEEMIATKSQTILVGNGRIEISIQGKPAHTAQPQNAINPVTIGAHVIAALEKIDLDQTSTVLNIFSFNSGDFKRGMADKADIVGVYYINTETDLGNLKININKVCDKLAEIYKTNINVIFTPFHAPTVNTLKETNLLLNAAQEIYPQNKVVTLNKSMIASEDFSEYLRHIPGCFFLVGAGEAAKPVHTNQCQFNDNLIEVAANVFCQVIINSLIPPNN